MASFALSDVSVSVSPCKDNDMAALEFHGGIAYDHEALPKIVAVHTLNLIDSEVNPEQINAQDVSVSDSKVKKTISAEIPLADKTASRHGIRRWIIRSKPELPFSQITTASKTPEEMFKPLTSSSSYDAFPKKKLFNFCDINHGYSYGDVYENDTPVPPTQTDLPTCTASKDSSRYLKISEHLKENIKQKETQAEMITRQSNETEKEQATKNLNEIAENEKETLKSLKDNSNHLGDSAIRLGRNLNLRQEDSPAEILTTSQYQVTKGIPSIKFLGQSVKTERREENKKPEIKASHATSLLPSEEAVTPCADNNEQLNQTSITAKTICSGPKLTSNGPKKTLGKNNDTFPIVGKRSHKKRVAVSKKNLASPIRLNSEQETSKNVKLTLRERVMNRIQRLKETQVVEMITRQSSETEKQKAREKLSEIEENENSKSYKELTSEAKKLYVKLAIYRKLGFGVASSLHELSKSGEINPKLEVTKNGQVKKKGLSEELLEEVVMMEALKKDRKTLKRECTTEHKNLDSGLNQTTSKNGMKEKEQTQNERNGTEASAVMEDFPSDSETGFVHADEEDSNVTHSIGSEPSQELQNMLQKVNSSDDLNAEKTLKDKQDVNWNERVDDVVQIFTPEKGKSLNKCVDKLKTITSSAKRKLESDKENGLHAYIPDSGSICKRPRKAMPRRLAKGRLSSHSDDDSVSPDTSWTDHAPDSLTSSDLDDQSSSSSFSTSDSKGQEREVTDEPLCDGRTPSKKSDLSPNEENLKIENVYYESTIISAQCIPEKLETSPSTRLPEPVSEGVTTTFDNASVKNLPLTRLFTKDTQKEQMEEAVWEPYWLSGEDKTAASNQFWVGVPCITIPQENYTIKTSLDREERIKALLAKQNQLLSKINSNVSGNSLS